MIDLPIAERELRIAARSVRTYASRRNTAGIAMLVFFWLYWMLGMRGGVAGAKVFGALSTLCLIYTLFAGIVLTSDCVSAEKREGTLGLLFLTALKPRDLVVGNILATSLKAFYGLLAVFPILGISFGMGGVSYDEFGRVCITLISTLVFSLSFSLFISCLSQKHLVATSRAAIAMIFFGAILPVACLGLRRLAPYGTPQQLVEILELFSPSFTMQRTGSSSFVLQRDFWWSLLIINCMSAGLLGLSSFILPHVWKDHVSIGRRWIITKKLPRFRISAEFLGSRLRGFNPFYWLASRRSYESMKFLIGSIALCVFASFVGRRFLSRLIGGPFPEFGAQVMAWGWAVAAMYAVLFFKCAALASHRFAEDRKSGALELVLVTPLTVRQILRGQWLALFRQLGGPILAALFLHGLLFWAFLAFCGMEQHIPTRDMWRVLKANLMNMEDIRLEIFFLACVGITILASALILCLNLIALGWVGMWVGLRTKRPALATWIALTVVVLPPLPIFASVLVFADSMGFSRNIFYWAPFCMYLGFGLELFHSILLIGWCRYKLRNRFRTAAADRFQIFSSARKTIIPKLKALGGGAVALLLLAALFYKEEKWRGLRAWRQLEREYAVRGQSLVTKLVVPPAVPDLENFGAATIFKPLFDYRIDGEAGVAWRDDASRKILQTVNVTGLERDFWKSDEAGPAANWALQQPVSLTNWQHFYQTNKVFASVCLTDAPATSVLNALSLFDPPLHEIETASRLPFSRFPIHYEEKWGAHVAHRFLLLNVAKILQLRAVARLDLGESDLALADLEFVFRLSDSFSAEPGLHPRRMRQMILASMLQTVWEGLARHRWSDANLKRLQALLKIDILRDYPDAVRQEIMMIADTWNLYAGADTAALQQMGFPPGMATSARFYPAGWKYLNQAGLYRLCERDLIPMVLPDSHRVFVPDKSTIQTAIRRSGVRIDPVFHFMFGAFGEFTPFLEPAKQFAFSQVSLDEAVIACALDRWRLSHGSFPPNLKSLIPDYLDRLPNDLITGNSHQYRLARDGKFVLYSFGWNGRDDGGASGRNTRTPSEENLDEGDWVWKY
ncbi:MAG: hypothetical protein JWM99_1436 [Verrucomicrobiales bacterium]|nr:hypothetical protein [Verrucomicrobiales bacterium]